MKLLNKKLEEANLKVKGGTMIVDSTIIESAARPRNIIESDNEPPTKTTSADPDAQWTKNGKGYHYG